jgi:cytochrome c peroxidase
MVRAASAIAVAACHTSAPEPYDAGLAPESSRAHEDGLDSPILPLPEEHDFDPRLTALGEALFFSPVLSEDGKVSCGSCHLLEHGLADLTALSAAPGRPVTATNSTTLFNVRYLYKVTWNGAFDSLDSHLDALIQSPKLMGSSWEALTARLQASPEWNARFRAIFAEGPSRERARQALLAYERSLVTPGADFDRWLSGERGALSETARRGYELFIEYGCVSCHQGMLVGGNMLQRLGVARDFFAEHPSANPSALGRYNFTQRDEDRHVFRVPSLRNVALTPPYLHDGSAPTLEGAISIMGEYQLGWRLPEADVAQLAQFLRSLTGKYAGTP